ncbi:MAG: hypothetical protein K2L87_02975, partial [Clostridiales bacterium]|nr:hypothetical protein [Clostridiales bacterium]
DVTTYIRGSGAELFTGAPLRAGAKATIQKWKSAGHEITILTARSKEWFTDPVGRSRAQLDKSGIVYDEIVACVWEKGEYCVSQGIDILIEDNFEICKKAQDLGINTIMFVDRHNREHADEIKYACSDWAQVESAVERIAEKG